jgi:hypothetical protein
MWKLYNIMTHDNNSSRNSKYNGINWNFYRFLLLISSSFITVAKGSAGNGYNAVITKGIRNRNVGSSRRPLVGNPAGNPNSGSSRTSTDSIIVSDQQRYILPKQPPLYDDLSSHRPIEPVELVSAVRF